MALSENVKIGLKIEAADSATTLGDLKTAAENLTEALEGAEIGSENYNKLNQALINTNKQVKNLELGFEALDAEQVASEVGSVAGAIGDIGTGLVLMSGGNEQLEEMVANIENALGVSMALKGGIEGLQSARKLWNDAMARGNQLTKVAIALQNGLSKALKSTLSVWGVLATAIIAVVAAISRWASEASIAEQAQEALNKASLEGAKAAGEEEAKLKILASTLMDATASTEARKDALDRLNEVIPDTIGFITEETIATGEAINVIQEYIRSVKQRAELAALEATLQDQVAQRVQKELELRMAGNDANGLAGDILKESIEVMKEGENVLLQQINSLQKQVSATENSGNSLAKTNTATRENIKLMKERTSSVDEDTEAVEDNNEALEENNTLLVDRRAAALEEITAVESEFLDSQLDKQTQEINAVQDKYFRLIELAKEFGLETATLEYAQQEEIAAIEQEFRDQEMEAVRQMKDEFIALEEAEAAEKQRIRQQTTQMGIAAAQSLFKSTEALFAMQSKKDLERAKEKVKRGQALSKAEEANLRRQEKIQKGFALAQIAVDTAMGIAGAVSSAQSMPYPANLVAIGTGIAAVMAGIVSASQVLGESSEIPQVDMPDVDLGDGANEATQDAPLSNFGSGSTLVPPQQVVVLESDISEVQNNVAVIESQATFG